uniref:Uncharacterized protein n=1 Tax=Panagrolaimus davidi TaxID=227884 RepID=A0A914Q760_9BILA
MRFGLIIAAQVRNSDGVISQPNDDASSPVTAATTTKTVITNSENAESEPEARNTYDGTLSGMSKLLF